MRKYGRIDGNQTDIVNKLRQLGAKVQILSSVGNGCPDLLVGWQKRNILMELKDESQPPSKRRLTVEEELWHKDWNERGQVNVVTCFDDALKLLNGQR